MAGGRHTEDRSGTPRGELSRIHDSRDRQAEQVQRRILRAMLIACGERGYRKVAVQDVIDRYEGNRVQFYRHFGSKAECYAAAHALELDSLGGQILEVAGAAGGWRLGVRAGLDELARFVEQEPLLARGLLVEVQVAGEPSMGRRAAAGERLARAIDRGREVAGGGHSPPPITARFMVGAIESTVTSALVVGDPEAFTAAVPELAHLIVSTYLGEDAAGEELAAATAA